MILLKKVVEIANEALLFIVYEKNLFPSHFHPSSFFLLLSSTISPLQSHGGLHLCIATPLSVQTPFLPSSFHSPFPLLFLLLFPPQIPTPLRANKPRPQSPTHGRVVLARKMEQEPVPNTPQKGPRRSRLPREFRFRRRR